MNFSEKAEIYEQISISQKQAADHFIKLLDFLKPTDKVLDVGCGTGYFTSLLREITGNIEGIDISPAMVETAQRIRPYIKFSCRDGENLAFEEKYDLITTNAVTYYFKDLHKTFCGFHDLLIEGGIYALQAQTIVTPEFTHAIDFLLEDGRTKEIFKDFKMPTHQLELEEYEKILVASGFEIQHSELIDYENEYTYEEVMNIFASGTATPLLDQRAYKKTLSDEYIKCFWDVIESGIKKQIQNGRMKLHVPRVYVIASKKTI